MLWSALPYFIHGLGRFSSSQRRMHARTGCQQHLPEVGLSGGFVSKLAGLLGMRDASRNTSVRSHMLSYAQAHAATKMRTVQSGRVGTINTDHAVWVLEGIEDASRQYMRKRLFRAETSTTYEDVLLSKTGVFTNSIVKAMLPGC